MLERPKLKKTKAKPVKPEPDKIEGGGNYFATPKTDVAFIPSGSKLLDLALGGGWAQDRIANVIGDESSGKTLLAIEACANFARRHADGFIGYRETEQAFLPDYAAALGMPLSRIEFGKPLETVEAWHDDLADCLKRCGAKAPGFYVLDSLDALSDAAELERDFGAASYGAQKAKDISKLFRMLTGDMARANLTLMIISQVRSRIGVVIGEKTTVSAGRALGFYSSQRVMLNRTGQIVRETSGVRRTVGVSVNAKVRKNKVGLPFREAAFDISFGYGIDDVESCLRWLKEAKALKPLGITETDRAIAEHARAMAKLDDAEYWRQVAAIYKLVEQRWWEIETSLLPKRSKYGAP